MKKRSRLFQAILIANTCLLTSGSAYATSLFVGHSNSERTIAIGDNQLDLYPSGEEVYFSADLSDYWSVSADYSKLEDSETLSLLLVDLEIESLGFGISYYAENWSLFYQYTDFEEQQFTRSSRPETDSLSTGNDGSSHSFSGSYFWTLNENWQLSASAGLHYNDWEESNFQIVNNPQPGNNINPTPVVTQESGDATLVSLSANVIRYSELSESVGFTFGTYIGWNEVLSSESELQAINNRNPNQIRNNNRGNNNNNFVITGSESYGIASLWFSFDFYQNWILDIDTSIDFGNGDSSRVWSISLGYIF